MRPPGAWSRSDRPVAAAPGHVDTRAVTRVRAACLVASLFACVAAGSVSAPCAAQQDPLAQGRAAYLDASFRRARQLLQRALQSPSLTRETATEAYRYLATVELLLGRADAARGHATRAVALDPAVQPPEGAGSRASRLFDQAREALDGAALSLRITTRQADDGTQVAVVLTPDVADLLARLYLRCEASSGAHEPLAADANLAGEREVRLRVPPSPPSYRCEATAETEHGAVLVRATRRVGRDRRASASARGRHGRAARDDGGGMPLWPWLVGGGALVVTAVAVGIAVASSGGDTVTVELGPVDVPAWR